MKTVAFRFLCFALLVGSSVTVLFAGPGFPRIAAKYKGTDVADGDTITGTVTIDPVPASAKFEIDRDQKICGDNQPNFRLVVDAATKGVKNVVVFLDGIAKGKKLAKKQSFVIDQKGCAYAPHILIAPKRSSIAFKSSDPIVHNVHVYRGTLDQPHSRAEDVLNVAFKDEAVPEQEIEKRALRRRGFLFIQCDAGHVWMSAYIFVVEHPYYVLTDEQGRFELKDVPPGTYTLRFWQEGWQAKPVREGDKITGYEYGAPVQHTASVTVKTGEAAKVDWAIPGAAK
ncbi:MAG: hypothetical protein V3T86_02480 [Planctomycetota bacterium]